MQRFRLAHPDLSFHVDITIRERDGRYIRPRTSFMALGEPYASELAAGAGDD
jgi:hypothetical protein